MFRQLQLLASQLAESALSGLGVRVVTQEPLHTVEPLIDGVEIRKYAARIAAETTVLAREEPARQEGFRRLIGYIFCANHEAEQTAMTTPVAQSGDRERGWLIRFYLPADSTIGTLPVPLDSRVHLVELPAETMAVLRFSGDLGTGAIAAQTVRLREALRASGFEPAGTPMAWFYDPPWTFPFLRRNEIAIPVCEYLGR